MRFAGSISAKLDAKGRVFFPSVFRRQLPETEMRFVLRLDDFQPCLVVSPFDAWEADVAELRARLSRWDARQATVLRRFMADVEVFTLDANGRFLIPKRYLEKAGIGQQVTFIGLDDRIEVWDKARADRPFMEAEDYAAALQELMSKES